MFTNIAYAMGGQAGQSQGSLTGMLVPMIAMFAIFYFLMIRPQQKKNKAHQAMVNSLKKGSRVITSGGIHGLVTKSDEATVSIEIADKVNIKVLRGNIAIVNPDKANNQDKKDKKAKK